MRLQSSVVLKDALHTPQIWNEPDSNLSCYVTYHRSLHHFFEGYVLHMCTMETKEQYCMLQIWRSTCFGLDALVCHFAATVRNICVQYRTLHKLQLLYLFWLGCIHPVVLCSCCERHMRPVQNMWRGTWENWAPGLDALAKHLAAAVRKRKWRDWKSWEGGQPVDKQWGFRRWMETKEGRTE